MGGWLEAAEGASLYVNMLPCPATAVVEVCQSVNSYIYQYINQFPSICFYQATFYHHILDHLGSFLVLPNVS